MKKSKLSFVLTSLLGSSFAMYSAASIAAPQVVTSVKPLQLIANEITQGVTEPELLLSSTASPHDYALKPSDIRKIKSADVMLWVGPELETFLDHLLEDEANSLQLSAQQDIHFLNFGEYNHSGAEHHDDGDHHDHADEHEHHEDGDHHEHADEHEHHEDGDHHEHADEHEHHDGEEEGHHGHSHTGKDPHIWLGPDQALETATILTQRLSELDAENAATYQANLASFKQNLAQKVTQIQEALAPIDAQGYYVFHDGYQYFESKFKLNNLGHFTVSPERSPGAKTLQTIREDLSAQNAVCVFAEPQFKPAIIETVVKGTDVKIGEIDPLGTKIDVKSGSYFDFLDSLKNSYLSCLKK